MLDAVDFMPFEMDSDGANCGSARPFPLILRVSCFLEALCDSASLLQTRNLLFEDSDLVREFLLGHYA